MKDEWQLPELVPGHSRIRKAGQTSSGVPIMEVEIDDGPWGVYDCYCMKCSKRYIGVAPVSAESINLWQCACGAWAVTWHLHEDDAE